MRDMCKGGANVYGSFLQRLPSGAFEGRSWGTTYSWAAPVQSYPDESSKEFLTYQDHYGNWKLFEGTEEEEENLCPCESCNDAKYKTGALRQYLDTEEKRYKDRLARVTEEAIWEREEEEEDKRREEFYASGCDDDGDDDYLEHMEEEEQMRAKWRRVALEEVCPPTLQDAHRLLNCAMP